MKFVCLFALLLSTAALASPTPAPSPSVNPVLRADQIAVLEAGRQVQYDQQTAQDAQYCTQSHGSNCPSPIPSQQVVADHAAYLSAQHQYLIDGRAVQAAQYCAQLASLGVSPCPSPSPTN